MERLRTSLRFTGEQLSKLTVSQRMLIGSLVVVMLMTLFVVSQYTSEPEMAPLVTNATAEELAGVESVLVSSGVSYEIKGGEVLVEAGRRRSLQAQLTSLGKMPADNTLYFDSLIDKQSWTRTTLQTHQMNTIAKQNELALIISNMSGVAKASVVMDVPMRRGLGQADRTPTASVTVFGSGIDQDTVDAVAHLVASSTSNLAIDQIRVIDGTTNRQFRARDDADFRAASYNEHVAKTERYVRDKLLDMVSYIDGAIVTVHAQVDVTREVTTRNAKLAEDDGSVRLKTNETGEDLNQNERREGGSPGARSNLQASIDGAGGSGTTIEESSADTRWEAAFGEEVKTIEDPRGHALKINAVVNIPRSYFVQVFNESGAAGDAGAEDGEARNTAADPTDTELAPVRDAEIERIRREVQSVVDMSAKHNGMQGDVLVSMVPIVPEALAATASTGGGVLGAASPGGLMASNLVKTLLLSLLAVFALGMVVFTTLRANRRESLPTAEEIVGVPPALDDHSSILGEAAEADSALPGIELSDEELAVRKMRDQISSMVNERPKRAADLVGHWIHDNH
jgi:flagellar M-ring protein FliF